MSVQARSIATRTRLLEATVAALVERGAHGTSLAEVCRRAGASKGALLHHYPRRADLFAAAADHLFALRLAELEEALALGDLADLDALLERLWAIYSGPTLAAWLELVVAARTDPALRVALARVDADLTRRAAALFRQVFGVEDPARATAGARTIMALFDGLSLNLVLGQGEDHARRVLPAVRELLAPWLGKKGSSP
ncbi:MAG: TetR family transcriptional regulator [Planctomycetota bacterium]|nr:MAG: TetR family transcriptional regulator [Planctomycetota bacterium]